MTDEGGFYSWVKIFDLTLIRPLAISLKIAKRSDPLWWVADDVARYRHIFEIGIVEGNDPTFAAIQICVGAIKLAVIWNTEK